MFVIEYVRMLIDTGVLRLLDGEWCFAEDLAVIAIPASIEAVLGARLDQLPAGELEVLQAAAVIGQEFDRDAIDELVPGARVADIGDWLGTLIDRNY